MLCNVLASAMQQLEPVTSICISLPLSLLPSTPSHSSRLSQSTRLSSLYYTTTSHQPSILYVACIYFFFFFGMHIFQYYSLNALFSKYSKCPRYFHHVALQLAKQITGVHLFINSFIECHLMHQVLFYFLGREQSTK